MNGKFMLIMFVCINLATLVGSSVCAEQINECHFGNNFVLGLFISSNSINEFSENGNATAGAGFNADFTSKAGDMNKQQSGGTFVESTGFSFLDGLKMVMGMLALLTPIPLISFIISAQLPLIFVVILGIVPVLLYVLAIMEFVRGASF